MAFIPKDARWYVAHLIRIVLLLARPLAILAMWLMATAFFGLSYFLSGRRGVEESVIFAVAFAGAAGISAAIALAIGGKRRWALEAALPMTFLIATPVGLAGVLMWLAPTIGGNALAADYFPRYHGPIPTAVLGITRQTIPTGAILGAGIGAIFGLLALLARSQPRLVQWVMVGLLLACVIDSTHIAAFDHVVEFVVKTRQEGMNRLQVSWTMRLELASAIGATAGAFVGAFVAFGAVRLSDTSRGSLRHKGHESVES